jgi:uncharacterized protein (TIGR03435 family)
MRLSELANVLSGMGPMTGVDRLVIDRTGLSGMFAFDIPFAPPRLPAGASTGPSLFTSLQEHLGLKLEATRSAVEVLVIDSVERPSPD